MSQSPIADPLAWRAITAPSLVDFEILANEVYRGLPKKFRTLCADLVIRIEDFATDEILDDMGIDSPFDLLGLFQGVGLPFRAESAPPAQRRGVVIPAVYFTAAWQFPHTRTSSASARPCKPCRDV